MKKEVLLLLTEDWADWEASYAIAGINSTEKYTVKTIALDKQPKVSIGNMRVEVDYAIESYQNFENLAMLILPGGFSWQKNDYSEIVEFLKKTRAHAVPVAAICGATIFLARNGFLDSVKHTGDEFSYFENLEGYSGKENFVPAQVVVDKAIITANETAAVAFAYEIFKVLKIDTDEEMDAWFDKFKNGMFVDTIQSKCAKCNG